MNLRSFRYRDLSEKLYHRLIDGSIYYTRHGAFDFELADTQKHELKYSSLHCRMTAYSGAWGDSGFYTYYLWRVSDRQVQQADRLILFGYNPDSADSLSVFDVPTHERHLWPGCIYKGMSSASRRTFIDPYEISLITLIDRYSKSPAPGPARLQQLLTPYLRAFHREWERDWERGEQPP